LHEGYGHEDFKGFSEFAFIVIQISILSNIRL